MHEKNQKQLNLFFLDGFFRTEVVKFFICEIVFDQEMHEEQEHSHSRS